MTSTPAETLKLALTTFTREFVILIHFYFVSYYKGLGSANYLRANLSLNDSINSKTAGNRPNDFSISSSRGMHFFYLRFKFLKVKFP